MLSNTLAIFLLSLSFSQAGSLHQLVRRSPNFLPAGVEPSANCTICKPSITFAGKEAKKYEVGDTIPTLPFKTKTSWAGQIEIPDTNTAQNVSLFFWYWSQDSLDSGNDLVIWLNGGPGCNSQIGGLTENGPFLIPTDDGPTRPNPYSWTIAADMLYINQPAGVTFTGGHSRNINEFQTSEQFAIWLKKFFEIFPELKKKRLWIAGESYAGYYLPFIFDAISRNPPDGNQSLLHGGMLVDPVFSSEDVQFAVPTYNFVKKNQKLLNFTNDDVEKVKKESDRCNLSNFTAENLHYPPRGRLPTPNPNCDPFYVYVKLARERSEHFNIYNVAKPHKQGKDVPEPFEIFLNDTNVQKYIHAPNEGYSTCLDEAFGKWSDRTLPPDQIPNYHNSYMARMIEHSKRFILTSGSLDGILMTEGTTLALQNLTWNNGQGFLKPACVPIYDMEGQQRAIGTEEERGLTYIEVPNSGHMVPGDQPSLGLASIEFLLGKRDWTKK